MRKQTTLKRIAGNKKGIKGVLVLGLLLFATCIIAVKDVSAQVVSSTTVDLGSAATFSIFGAAGVTTTGATTITGDVGTTSTLSSDTGFSPVTHGTYATSSLVTGDLYSSDYEPSGTFVTTVASDIQTCYTDAAGLTPVTQTLTGTDLGGLTLTPGVYFFSSSAQLTGTLTLNGPGVYVFQIGSTLTTASSSKVVLENAAASCDVVWQVTSQATLGEDSTFVGNILAQSEVAVDSGVTVNGTLFAHDGPVTLIGDTISNTQIYGPPTFVLPEYPIGTIAALGGCFAALLVYKRKSLPHLHLNIHS
jgi:hypothetical protein